MGLQGKMMEEEERKALMEKAAEIRKITAEAEARFLKIPVHPDTEVFRSMMEDMLAKLHSMEKKVAVVLQTMDETQAKGGKENGSN